MKDAELACSLGKVEENRGINDGRGEFLKKWVVTGLAIEGFFKLTCHCSWCLNFQLFQKRSGSPQAWALRGLGFPATASVSWVQLQTPFGGQSEILLQNSRVAYVLIVNWVLCLDNLFILEGCCYPLQPIDQVEGLTPLLEQTSNFFQFTSNPSSNSVWSECVTKTSIALILQCEMHVLEHRETDGKECSSSVPKAF